MNKHLYTVAFFLGALGIVWMGVGFIDSSILALVMTAIIGAVYVFGALELRQFRSATSTLTKALEVIPENITELGDWLLSVPASLQNCVRLRIEGERVGLPGPTLTPYLVGLLVMLGMLGTFLGMVVTLNGAVFALEKTTDLEAIRSALAVPVKGLGLAFGTSVAGVAASAMLGLMSALSRRERMLSGQLLDTKIATVLRRFSLTHQRQESFKAQQLQAQALPLVVEQLQAMMAQMADMNRQLGLELSQRLLSNQESFHSSVKGVYTELAVAVDHSLRESLSQSAHVAGESLKPVVEAAMTAIARDASLMHERMADTVQTQLDGLAARFRLATTSVADNWTAALSRHEQASTSIVTRMDSTLLGFNDIFEQRTSALVETWAAALNRHEQASAGVVTQMGSTLAGFNDTFEQRSSVLVDTWTAALSRHEQASAGVIAGVDSALEKFSDTFEARSGALVASVGEAYASLQTDHSARDTAQQLAWTESLKVMAEVLTLELQKMGSQTLSQQQEICSTLTRSVQDITEHAQTSTSNSLDETTRLIASAEALMHSRIAAEAHWLEQHRERMDQLANLLRTELGALKVEEAARGDAAVERLGQLQTALTSHLTTLGTALEEPITRLIQTASEAPRAAAEVIVQLRQEISSNVARDNELLEERSRIMETLNALLDAINHASVEQRDVIDSLVASSAVALEATGSAFSDNVASEAAKLSDIAAHVTSSAVDVASLSEAFGFAVHSFSEANEKLIANLQRIEGAMDKSMSRSDEQLAYYVAQAREIIDLSMMSQKEVLEGLRQLPANQAMLAEEAR